MAPLKLSVLDLVPLRRNQTTRQALHTSRRLAHLADSLGYTRYWLAEHHNMPAIASTVPAVLIPYLAQDTENIRFGSGGVMLANHAPFSVAEQFGLLAEMFPDRIDLGLGRAPGSEPLTAAILRQGLPGDGVENYANDVELLREMLGSGSTPLGSPVPLNVGGRRYDIHATPASTSAVALWLLGSSAHSAQLAASMGLPYVFANHFGIPGMAQILTIYRDHFVPSPQFPKPTTFAPVNVVVGKTEEEAARLALPYRLTTARLRTGGKVDPQALVEDAVGYDWSPQEAAVANIAAPFLYVGTPENVASGLRDLAGDVGVDELMIVPSAGAYEDDDVNMSASREYALEALAEQLIGDVAEDSGDA